MPPIQPDRVIQDTAGQAKQLTPCSSSEHVPKETGRGRFPAPNSHQSEVVASDYPLAHFRLTALSQPLTEAADIEALHELGEHAVAEQDSDEPRKIGQRQRHQPEMLPSGENGR